LIAENDCNAFLDAVETEHLEFKSEPYQLDKNSQKLELAKDVSGLANAGGGLILLGFKTTKDANILGEMVMELRPIPFSCFSHDQYSGVINDWIYPAPHFALTWLPSSSDHGFAVIDVSAGDPDTVPHLTTSAVIQGEKKSEIIFGYCERRRASVQSASVQQMHALIRSGKNTRELFSQYALIQDTLKQMADLQVASSEAKNAAAQSAEQHGAFKRDKQQALAAANLESVPNLLLATFPSETVNMRGLFNPSESDLISVLSNRPTLKGNGWDLRMDRPLENIHGRLRRSLIQGYKLFQLSREGVLLFLALGNDDFLAWNVGQKTGLPLYIQPFVLAHVIYVFALVAKSVFQFAAPPPRKLVHVVELRNMEIEGKPARLHPDHGKQNAFLQEFSYRAMPWASEHFEVETPFETGPGEITYALVCKVFEWFGFDHNEVPYARLEDGKPLIDEISLFDPQSHRA
jgi:hypothetical protein